MIKFLRFVLNDGNEHIFPLESLLYVRVIPTMTAYTEVLIVYKESSDYSYQIRVKINSTEIHGFIDKLMIGITELQLEEKTLLTFTFETGDFYGRHNTH